MVAKAGGTREISAEDEKTNFFTGSQTRKFLKAMGMEPRKGGQIPSKADLQEQKAFKEGQLEPRLKKAKAGQRLVFFMDGCAFCLCTVSGAALVL